jgi:hypothetical protein
MSWDLFADKPNRPKDLWDRIRLKPSALFVFPFPAPANDVISYRGAALLFEEKVYYFYNNKAITNVKRSCYSCPHRKDIGTK